MVALGVAEVLDVAGRILVLFDIDGTLIHSGGAGVRGMAAAVAALHTHPGALADVPVAGRTDRAIVRDVLARIGLPDTEDQVAALRDAYLRELPNALAQPPEGTFGVLPGVPEALDALSTDDRFTVGLLTGNFATGARIKLEFFGLWQRFALGAYGDRHVNRRDLVPLAVAESREAGWPPAAVVVIGDTPLDVDCALAHGAIAVGVATGHTTPAELADAGAHLVVDTLESLTPIADRLAGLCRQQSMTNRRESR
jgi:phosphoglycolate phosphatase-like HAD superfamily hydrolase